MSKDLLNIDSFQLCDENTGQISIAVWARVENGEFHIDGQDLGSSLEDIFGSDEYEYFYRLDSDNTRKLFELLTNDISNIKETIIKNFSGIDGCKKFRDICEKNGIEYKFFTYS